MRFLVTISMFILLLQIARAQDNKPKDLIRFNDGSKLSGTISQYEKGQVVVIKNGNITTRIEGSDYDNISEILFDHYTFFKKNNQWWYEINLGTSLGKTSEFSSNESQPFINGLVGFQFSQFAGVGLGTGFHGTNTMNILPIYATFRGDLTQTKVTPFYYSDIGYGISTTKDRTDPWGSETFKGGLLFGVGLGTKFRLRKTYLSMSLGYRIQRTKTTREFQNFFSDAIFSGGESVTEERTQKRAELRLGIGF